MRNSYAILILLVTLASCSGNKTTETKSPGQTAKDFLCWYNDNYKTISKIELVKNNPPLDDTTLFYSVNFEGTEQWLKMFKESGFVSDEFIEHWRTYFKECETGFQASHESDGPPSGFDYDFIFNSQEEFPANELIQKATVNPDNQEGDRVTLNLVLQGYGEITKTLAKSSEGKWLITE